MPVTISQISFNKKSQVENHIIMIGDAAGMITPLCGNGMSIALQSGKIAATTIHQYLEGSVTRTELEKNYTRQWQQQFARRLRAGRVLQRVFGNKIFTNIFISLIKPFPKLVTVLINQTHGENY
jgi:flavin-dependent dehydrogenase